MKKKNLKLNFNKHIIAKLNPSEQSLIIGAATTSASCWSDCIGICFSEPINC
ncbi:MAG: class I lanthipeptide [Hyphomicrobiales bacterium]